MKHKYEDFQKIEKIKTEAKHSALELMIDKLLEILWYENSRISEIVEIKKKAGVKRNLNVF